ncbi:MAG: LamG-like jellyroll fold domain-containing protein [Flavobacteriaceae bacterium]
MHFRFLLFFLLGSVVLWAQETISPLAISAASSQSSNLSISAQTASGTSLSIDRISTAIGLPFLGINQTTPQTVNATYTQNYERDFGFPWGVFYSYNTFSESFFEVSKGYYTDRIKLSWQILNNQDKITSINIYRTEDVDSDQPAWGNPLQNLSATTTSFEDTNTEGGKLYRYKVQVVSSETNGNVDLAGVNNLYTGFIEGIGYRNPSGLITGNVTYEGGNPVQGVTITAVPDGGSSQIGTSLSIPADAKLQVDAFHESLQDELTVQQWIKPFYAFQADTLQLFELESDAGEKINALLSYTLDDGIRLEVASNTFLINGYIPSGKVDNGSNDLMIEAANINTKFTHISLVLKQNEVPLLYINGRKIDADYVNDQNTRLEDGEMTLTTTTQTLQLNYDSNGIEHSWTKISVGGRKKALIDELRLYAKALAEEEIFTDFRRYLRGNESDLHVYLRFNEGRGKFAYDLAYKGFTYYGNDGRFVSQNDPIQWASDSDQLPEADQLGILGVTDANGNYVISSIQYQGSGETYLITPSLGRHQFAPSQELVFIGEGSTVINNVDFIDKSSFTFRGRILYDSRGVFPQGPDSDDVTGDIRDNEAYNAYVVGDIKYPKGEYWAEYGTGNSSQTIVRLNRYAPIPLSGAYVYIDNQLVISDENIPVESDDEGRFTISVPIGMHSIRVEKQGHDFIYEGRFPKKDTIVSQDQTRVVNTNFDFFEDTDEEVIFIDETRIDYVGRVVGGTIEGDKPLGFGYDGAQSFQVSSTSPEIVYTSKNNIGTASVTLGYRQPGATSITDEYKSVFSTNSETGEFRVSLLPLRYELDQNDLYIPSQTTDVRRFLDASQVLNFSTINIPVEEHYLYEGDTIASTLPYNYKSKFIYRATPEINVLSQTHENEITVGEASYTVTGTNFALYNQGGKYSIKVQKLERYFNYELPSNEQLSTVPVTDGELVVTNNLVDSRPGSAYFEENEADQSIVTYHFMAGMPNTDVSSNFQSTLSLLYRLNTVDYPITGYLNNGVIIGSKSSGGQTFETAGPEIPDIILRDPPGSESFATIEQGSSFSSSREYAGAVGSTIGASIGVKVGLKVGVGGGLLGPLIESESYVQGTTGINFGFSSNFGNELTTNYSFSQSISTSDDPDWVGADADLYIGTSYNQFYGVMDNIEPTLAQVTDTNSAVVSIPVNTTSGTIYISKNKALFFSPGDERTVFIYSQRQILTDIIPFYTEIYDNYDCIVNNTDPCPISIDGDIKPRVWYDSQIKLWRRVIQINEETKYLANSDREGLRQRIESDFQTYFTPGDTEGQSNDSGTFFNPAGETLNRMFQENFFENISFDSGLGEFTKTVGTGKTDVNEYTVGFEIEQSNELEVVLDYGGNGGTIKVENKNTASFEYTNNDETETTLDISYTLKDGDDYNKFSIDVVNAFDGNGPVFVTKGGETSCPVEEATFSYFFHPEQQPVAEDSATSILTLAENQRVEISKGTIAIEVPYIEVENASVSNVQQATAAEFTIRLRNDSVLEPEESEFILYVDQTTNPNNAIINLDDTGTPFYLDGGETVEYTLTLEKGSSNITEYNDIRIVFESMCDADLSEEIFISAGFVDSCAKVEILDPLDQWVINNSTAYTSNDETIPLLIEMQSFDYDDSSLERIDLEYRMEGSPSWTKLQTYVSSETIYNQLISNGESEVSSITTSEFTYSWDIAQEGLPDGNYQLRARTTCFNGTEYNSIVINGKVDLSAPILFGTPNPSDGILSLGDDITARFNEEIKANGTLTRYEFLVQKNQLPVQHEVSLAFSADTHQGEIERPFISSGDFGLEFWLKNEVTSGPAKLISQQEGVNVQLTSNQLTFVLGSETLSAPIQSDGAYHHYALSYEAETGNIQIVENDNIVGQQTVTQNLNFSSNNSIFIGGENFRGNLHDLRLWRKSISREDAVANMNTLLNGNENNLLGYWPMNEGNGQIAKDYSRSKQMILSNVNWEIFPSTTAYAFNGSNYLSLDQANRSVITARQDITLSFWFKTGQAGPATLISNGKGDASDDLANNGYRNKWAISLDSQNRLSLNAENNSYPFGSEQINDNNWHHAAIVVRRYGNMLLFLDGERVSSYSNEEIGGFSGSTVFLGARGQILSDGTMNIDQYYNGSIDELRLWNTARTTDQIKEDRYFEADYTSTGLLLYAPFNQPDQANANGPKYWYPFNSFEMRSEYANLNGSALAYTSVSPPVKPKRPTERLVVEGVINYDELLLNPQITDWASIENKIAYITVANLYDMSDNRQLSPVTWTALINKNPLKWYIEGEGTSVDFVKEEAASFTFEITLVNRSGTGQPYAITTPDWISIDEATGSVPPGGVIKLTASIQPELSSGVYEDQLILSSDYSFNERIDVRLRVRAPEPNWNLSPTEFEQSMTILGKIRIDNSFSDDPNDRVVAYRDGEVRGVVGLTYEESYDDYFAYLTVYSNPTDSGNLSFKIWDASAGRIKDANINGAATIPFTENGLLGGFSAPIIFDNNGLESQEIIFNQGWTWISLNVSNSDFSDLNTLFNGLELATLDKIMSAGPARFDQYEEDLANPNNSGWFGSISSSNGLTTEKMYKVKLAQGQQFLISGNKVDLSQWSFQIQQNWNWLPYVVGRNVPIDEALANYNPQNGDLIKSQTQFAIYDGSNGWRGSLTYLYEGQGYMLKASSAQTFTYADYLNSTEKSRQNDKDSAPVVKQAFAAYSSNMNLIAKIPTRFNGIRVYDNDGNLVGEAFTSREGFEEYRTLFATIYGNSYQDLKVVLLEGDKEVPTSTSLVFVADALYGTVNTPLIIEEDTLIRATFYAAPNPFTDYVNVDFQATTSGSAILYVFDVNNREITAQNITIVEGENSARIQFEQLPRGTYILQLRFNGNTYSKLLIKN